MKEHRKVNNNIRHDKRQPLENDLFCKTTLQYVGQSKTTSKEMGLYDSMLHFCSGTYNIKIIILDRPTLLLTC